MVINMNTYILLLRGINVGGHRKIKMADLKTALEKLKFKEVQTYIQSGNIVFKYIEKDVKILVKEIEYMIQKKFDFEARALVVLAENFKKIFKKNPYLPEKENEIEKLYCTFLFDLPEDSNLSLLNEVSSPDDQYIFGNACMYFLYNNGYGRAKISNSFIERKLKVLATTRNWKTMIKLMEMVSK